MQMGLAERIRTVLGLDPAKGAIEFKGHWYSWGELGGCMSAIDDILKEADLGEGAPVALILRNRPAHAAAVVEVIASHRCVASVNPFQGAEKIAADIGGLNVAAVVADEEDWQNPALKALVEERGMVGIQISAGDTLAAIRITENATPSKPPYHEAIPETAILMLTSGTTGPAKRIKLPYQSFQKALLSTKKNDAEIKLQNGVAILSGPLVHIGGMYFAMDSVIHGRSFCLLEKFSVAEWVRVVSTYKPKVGSLPPTAIRMVMDADIPKEDLSSLTAIIAGSAPLPVELQDKFEDYYGIPILDVYGATEFGGGIASWNLKDHKEFGKAKRGSVGRAQPGVKLRVVDQETGEELPTGEQGVLEVQSAQSGQDGWVRTTDLALIDEDGFLFLKGRADDAIVRGGFKVLPREVEKVIQEHPAVKTACVVGVEDERLGAVPQCAVELVEGQTVTPEELNQFVRSKVVAYQVPTKFIVVDELPRTPSMKVSFYEVKKLLAAA